MMKLTAEDRESIITQANQKLHKHTHTGIRGQIITEWDSIDSWVVVETLQFLNSQKTSPVGLTENDREIIIERGNLKFYHYVRAHELENPGVECDCIENFIIDETLRYIDLN